MHSWTCEKTMVCPVSELTEAKWHIYASLNWVIIGSDNCLSPVPGPAFIWTNAGLLLIVPRGTNFNAVSFKINILFTKKMILKYDVFFNVCTNSHDANVTSLYCYFPMSSRVVSLITVMSHERHGVSNHRPLESLFDILYGPTSKKHQWSAL